MTELESKHPLQVRYARDFGWLQVRDVFDGRWHEIQASDAPPSWRRAAYMDKQQRRLEGRPR